ncbi:chromosome segregation protein SMC [Falsibacillus albus]|uniref:Chromosome partition protein Smc n=1 Tax=Falsibacillus albus TaxID=2478915 RepID=A0A3L7K4Z1_9BACI|nr:chromosome segregation protein SMC [Falsibacillus albus]RLQ95772.1 chromosome segregation protein SMC [Falsibacillus albus]
MFLKHLDVVGFKSFAERISIDFVPGVTAVVGPNGSGKSNITDSIRWVLGEQSAKSLRGAKMEDIIFAGSDSRKGLNFAEVSLTLDNEDRFLPIDYFEVCVTRRVYRSGDSEFLINKQSCRLKDIIDLFMDSGLGREAFSIISQGKVEEILNSKAENRRSIFEEAAGVLKYKTRKKKAETRLFETQENLNRVNDILHELEGQVEPLKIQASMAKDYLEKKEELEKYEVALTVQDIEELHRRWEKLKEDFEQHQQQESEYSAEINQREANLAGTRDRLGALDESINGLQQALLTASEELEKLEGRKEVLKERQKNASQNKEQLQKNIEEAALKQKELEEQKLLYEQELALQKEEAENLKNALREKNELIQQFDANIEERIESLKSDYIELLNGQASSKNELQYLDQQLTQQLSRNEKLDAENQKYIELRKKILEEKQFHQQELSGIKEKLEVQVHSFREAKQKLESLRNQYQKQETTLYQAYQYLQKSKSRKEMLEEMEEEYTGFFQGVREVLKARSNKLPGIEGAVAELVKVPKEFETAMETALASSMQHVVVQTEDHGRQAIAFLKKHQYGRATFLPMSVLKSKKLASSQVHMLSQHDEFVGLGADLIKFDSAYQNIFENLLGSVVITKTLKGANQLAKLLQYRYRIVTLEGDVVNPGGSMTGGTIKQKNNSLLSRKGELEDIKEKLVTMEQKTHQLENHVRSIKNDVSLQEKSLDEMRQTGESLRIKEEQVKAELRQTEAQEASMNERLGVYDIEMETYTAERDRISQRKDELSETLEQGKAKLKALDEEIELLTKKKDLQRHSKDSLIGEISDLKAALAVKNEQLASSKDRLERLKRELAEISQKKSNYEDNLHWLDNEMDGTDSGEEELSNAAELKRKDKFETAALISTRREDRVKLQSELEGHELELKELKRQYKGLVEVLKDEEVKINRLDVELETRLAHLREEYMLSFEAAKAEYVLEVPIDEARKKVKLIKMAISELGNVNLGAIDEYERVAERYDFLKMQQSDLQEAKETLYKVMDEMDDEMIKRFSETFEAIRSHFEFVFRALFGGGRAELKLTDPSDLLNTGVEIVAQPPGKKLQNLGLLSGGERALTAIALLFSILKVRPVPFCILDEVEAALDEANVHRFAKYLRNFSQETQFIVITHRKGTMEEADVLYGVTMQESGVSKLVSVKLEESQELVKA